MFNKMNTVDEQVIYVLVTDILGIICDKVSADGQEPQFFTFDTLECHLTGLLKCANVVDRKNIQLTAWRRIMNALRGTTLTPDDFRTILRYTHEHAPPYPHLIAHILNPSFDTQENYDRIFRKWELRDSPVDPETLKSLRIANKVYYSFTPNRAT